MRSTIRALSNFSTFLNKSSVLKRLWSQYKSNKAKKLKYRRLASMQSFMPKSLKSTKEDGVLSPKVKTKQRNAQ